MCVPVVSLIITMFTLESLCAWKNIGKVLWTVLRQACPVSSICIVEPADKSIMFFLQDLVEMLSFFVHHLLCLHVLYLGLSLVMHILLHLHLCPGLPLSNFDNFLSGHVSVLLRKTLLVSNPSGLINSKIILPSEVATPVTAQIVSNLKELPDSPPDV